MANVEGGGLAGLALAGLLAAAPAGAAITPATSPAGHLLLIGGGEKPAAVMDRFVELAGGGARPIAVVPTASGEPDTGSYYQRLLREHGAGEVRVVDIRTPADAARPELVEALRSAAGIFFAGGDQRRITEAFVGTPALDAVREAYAGGAVIGGTSAGTACMSGLMITGDGDFEVITADNVVLWEGLGLFPGAILDQHFVARQRQNRLLAATLEHPELVGIGIDEATAVLLRPDGVFEVLGEGWVQVYDATEAAVSRRQAGEAVHLGARGVTLHLLQPGETFDLKARRPLPAAEAAP